MKPDTILKIVKSTDKLVQQNNGKLNNISGIVKDIKKRQNTQKVIIIIIAIICVLTLLLSINNTIHISNPQPLSESQPATTSNTSEQVDPQILGIIIDEPDIDELANKIIECESNWRHLDKNGNLLVGDKHLTYQALGIAQFQRRTFDFLSKLAGRTDLRIESEQDQIWLLDWAIKNGYEHYWSCFEQVN